MPTATILTSVNMFGEMRAPGDVLTAEQVATISETVRGALVREGILALEGSEAPTPTISAKEKRLATKAAKAREALGAAERELGTFRRARDQAVQAVEAKARERAPYLLPAERGDQKARDAADLLLDEQNIAQRRAGDLEVVIAEAEAQKAALAAALEAAERDRLEAEVERLAGNRAETCREIERRLAELLPHVAAYRKIGRQLTRALGADAGSQIGAEWRLEAVLDSALGRPVDPGMREPVANFAEFEMGVVEAVKKRAFPAKSNGAAA
jgi:hypothetical protein